MLMRSDQTTEALPILMEHGPGAGGMIFPPSAGISQFVRQPITARLKNDLAHIHTELEQLSQIPDRLRTARDYLACLEMYLGIFQPLETRLAAHTGWAALGIDFDERRRTPALIADIIALGGVVSLAPAADEETLQSFEAALGALYVLEGSTLGGKFILRAIEGTLGARVAGATRFFEGHGAKTGQLWIAFKQAVDAYGEEHERAYEMILAGAVYCFDLFIQAAKTYNRQ